MIHARRISNFDLADTYLAVTLGPVSEAKRRHRGKAPGEAEHDAA